MANVSSSNGLEKRPKLRFPGFDEPWKAEKLSDFASRVTRKNSKNETDLPLTISSKDGLVDQVSYFNKTVASKDMSGYYLLKNGEFAYNKSYSVGYDFGSIKRLDRYPMGALSTLYICFALKRHDSDFIKAYFDSLKWYDFFQLLKVILLSVSLRYDPINHICGDEEQDTEHKEQYRTQFVFSFHGASLSQEKRRDRCLSYPVSPPASLSLTVFAFIFTFAPQQCNNCTHAGNS